MDGANKLLDAAEYYLDAEAASNDAADSWRKADDLLNAATDNADEVERVMEIAQKFEDEARRLTHTGWLRGLEASATEGSPGTYVAEAEQRLKDASGVTEGVPNQQDPILAALKNRVAATKGRIADVRLRLGHGEP